MSYLLFPSSGNHVTLEPEWNFDRKDAQVKNEHVTRGGKRYVYKWGSYVKFGFGLTFVNSSDAARINSWWITNTKLQFMEKNAHTRDSGVWNFANTTDGWGSLLGGLTTTASAMTLTTSAADANVNISNLSIVGADNRYLMMRLKKLGTILAWEGIVFHSTSAHGQSSSYYLSISEPSGINSDYVIAVWDMHNLTFGGADWRDNTITALRFDLSTANSAQFAIDWIDYGNDPVFDSRSTAVFSVMLIASDLPMGSFQKPYTDKFKGTIDLQGY